MPQQINTEQFESNLQQVLTKNLAENNAFWDRDGIILLRLEIMAELEECKVEPIKKEE